MASSHQKRNTHRQADRFYEYMMAHKREILRYIIVALATGIIQYILKRFLPSSDASVMLPFAIRFLLMFYLLKYWAYQEFGAGGFYTGRQMMLAIMITVISAFIFNYIIIFFTTVTGKFRIVNYIVQAVQEIFYFIIYQFLIFKDPRNN